jgi:DNA-binding FadR family transcriptional regulator
MNFKSMKAKSIDAKSMDTRIQPQKPSASSLGISAISPHRAFDEITTRLRELVARGDLKPGDRLPAERELAASFNVSRNTLREALRGLELAGIIELRKGAAGGAFVKAGDLRVAANAMRDLYHLGAISPAQLTEARIWIESAVIRAACERMSEDDLVALEENVALAARYQKAGDFEARTRAHQEFHKLLGAATGNPILMICVGGVMEVMNLFVESIGPRDNPYTVPSRRRLLKHLRARDAEKAVAEMTRFLMRLHAEYLQRWKTMNPD